MKPFDLASAKAGKPLIQRDGTKVRFIAHVPDSLESSRIVVMNEQYRVMSFRAESGRHVFCRETSDLDLFMAPVKKTYWANVWRDRASVFVGKLFANEAEATENKRAIESIATYYTYLKLIQIELEE